MTDILDADTGAPAASANTSADVNGTKAADKVRRLGEKVQTTAEQAATQISEKVSKAAERGVEAYDQAAARARKMAETVDPFVREKPYAAIGAVLGVGVVIGMLLAARSPKVIYIKPGH